VNRQPVLFVSHGAPTAALDRGPYAAALRRFGEQLTGAARPSAIAVVSAHWQVRGLIGVTGAPRPETIHDFFGFPEPLYRLRYDVPGDPRLAARIAARLSGAGVPAMVDPARGLDHGAWVPLRLALPEASIPVVQVALPAVPPEALLGLGEALRPLRDEGVLLVASGGLVHNLGAVDFDNPDGPPVAWAAEFDRWAWERAGLQEREALARWRLLAPHPAQAHPTSDHFDPLLVALGAAWPGERAEPIFDAIAYGSLSLRTFAYRPQPQSKEQHT
jgi:4,5-DOPA dioxygenase extradiol